MATYKMLEQQQLFKISILTILVETRGPSTVYDDVCNSSAKQISLKNKSIGGGRHGKVLESCAGGDEKYNLHLIQKYKDKTRKNTKEKKILVGELGIIYIYKQYCRYTSCFVLKITH